MPRAAEIDILNRALIRKIREGLNLSQDDMAKRAGAPGRAWWCDLENGRRTLNLAALAKVAMALKKQPAELLLPIKLNGSKNGR